MNETNFEHAIFAVLMQIAAGLLTGNWWIGAAAGAFFFLGREHAQAENRAKKEGWAKYPEFECLAPRFWSMDAVLDWVCPAVAVVLVALGWHLGVSVPFVALFAALVLLNIADAVLTVRVLDQGGRELNPAMAKVMEWIGVVPALVVMKVAGLVAVYVALAVKSPGWAYAPHVTAVLCGLYGLVVCNNWRQMAGKA